MAVGCICFQEFSDKVGSPSAFLCKLIKDTNLFISGFYIVGNLHPLMATEGN